VEHVNIDARLIFYAVSTMMDVALDDIFLRRDSLKKILSIKFCENMPFLKRPGLCRIAEIRNEHKYLTKRLSYIAIDENREKNQ